MLTGLRGGFEDNALCFYARMLTDNESPQRYECDVPLHGDVISIQTVDQLTSDPLHIYEININT